MLLSQLIARLKDYRVEYYGSEDTEFDLQTVRYYVHSNKPSNPYTLYLANTRRLPEPSENIRACIFCYGSRIDFSPYVGTQTGLVYLGEEVSSHELFNDLLEELTEVEQITAGLHILSNALFSGNGLQYLVNQAAVVFENPISVVDLQGKYLAISEWSGAADPIIEEAENGYISEDGMALIRRMKLDEKMRATGRAIYFDNPMLGHGTLLDAVYIQGIEVAHIMLQELGRPFDRFDPELLHRFGSMVAIELQKSSYYTRNKGVMYSYALSDLLGTPGVNIAAVKSNLNSLGYILKEDLYIMVIPATSYYSSDLRTDIILHTIQQILPGSLYSVYEDTLVFLFSKNRYEGFTDYERERLKTFLAVNQLSAGISNFFEKLEDASRFYSQAVTAVELGTRLDGRHGLYYYRDYYIFHMLNIYEQTDSELRYLIQPGLMRLLFYDRDRGTNFLETLGAYLSFPGQPARVAEALHVHKNTLLYRMKKIREITHCSFEDGEQCMAYYISYKIMDYLGELTDSRGEVYEFRKKASESENMERGSVK
ncbi:MAG: helix-turn-helix domain-containing protein [Eubacterium sp.]|nr:helix-turn-helix domain-containing protein [Eubacterium sp.]